MSGRVVLNDSPEVWLIDNRDLDSAIPYGQYLIRRSEFGLSVAWREEPYDTWSPPLHGKGVT